VFSTMTETGVEAAYPPVAIADSSSSSSSPRAPGDPVDPLAPTF
jgi:hypothetical protein